jgi:GxxExxY protein
MKQINDELTYRIIGCAMKVHNTLGNGFQEVIYQRCLAIELGKQGIQFLREQEMPIHYDDKWWAQDEQILLWRVAY